MTSPSQASGYPEEEGLGLAEDTLPLLPELLASPHGSPVTSSATSALQTLTSGRKREIRGGALQAHICVIGSETDIVEVITAFREADAFKAVASWAYAFRLASPEYPGGISEAVEDGLDEGCGERILGVLRRCGLNG